MRRGRPEPSLWDLQCNADRAGLFCSWTPEPTTGCYLWTGRELSKGYGAVSMCGRTLLAHRCVYRLLVEDVGADMEVHHCCEQPGCINPRHLVGLTTKQHRNVHSGRGKAWVEFIGATSPNARDALAVLGQGFIGLPFEVPVLDLGEVRP